MLSEAATPAFTHILLLPTQYVTLRAQPQNTPNPFIRIRTALAGLSCAPPAGAAEEERIFRSV